MKFASKDHRTSSFYKQLWGKFWKDVFDSFILPQILILVVIQHGKQDPLYFLRWKEIQEGHHRGMLSAFVKEHNHSILKISIKWRSSNKNHEDTITKNGIQNNVCYNPHTTTKLTYTGVTFKPIMEGEQCNQNTNRKHPTLLEEIK